MFTESRLRIPAELLAIKTQPLCGKTERPDCSFLPQRSRVAKVQSLSDGCSSPLVLLPRQKLLRRHQKIEIIAAIDLGVEFAAVDEAGAGGLAFGRISLQVTSVVLIAKILRQ